MGKDKKPAKPSTSKGCTQPLSEGERKKILDEIARAQAAAELSRTNDPRNGGPTPDQNCEGARTAYEYRFCHMFPPIPRKQPAAAPQASSTHPLPSASMETTQPTSAPAEITQQPK